MTCGAAVDTCLFVGDVDISYLPFMQMVIDTYGWRIFHLSTSDEKLWNDPHYRHHKGDPDSELLVRTLFVQYDFCAVVEVNLLTMVVEDTARAQWDGDWQNRRYLRMGSGVMTSRIVDGFMCDTSFDSMVLNKNITTVVGLLDSCTPLPEKIPFF